MTGQSSDNDKECSEVALASPFVDPWHHPIEPVVHPRPRLFRKFLPRQAEGVYQLTEWNLVIDGDLFGLGFELALALQNGAPEVAPGPCHRGRHQSERDNPVNQ